MRLVESHDHILDNVKALERAAKFPTKDARFREYARLIHHGRCFYPYLSNGALHFAPSRFIGYRSNDITKHASGKKRDGRKTNAAISSVLGLPLEENGDLDTLFTRFCDDLNESGEFSVGNHARKYWITSDADGFTSEGIETRIKNDASLSGATRKALIDARVGQGKFRKDLIKYWRGQCAATKCRTVRVLKASHIKPWKFCTDKERLDVFNGLLLSPNIDSLFDLGFITFDERGRIVISRSLKRSDADMLLPSSISPITLTAEHRVYLAYHRSSVFRS
ncbi:MAG: HNH endonuclease [Burkholderiales bacterium]